MTTIVKGVIKAVCFSVLIALSNLVSAQPKSHIESQFDQLIKAYWRPASTIHGIDTTVFDYAAMKKDADNPDSLFVKLRSELSTFDPTTIQDRDAAKAFWINAYNFGAWELIMEHYPVDSIRSLKISWLKHPWSKDVVNISGRMYSLAEIEHDILLKDYNDPRILFAVSCAAVSCPDRKAEAFTGANLNNQLDQMISAFFTNSGKGLKLDEDKKVLTLSWILKKDRETIVGKSAGDAELLEFVLPYLETPLRDWLNNHKVEIEFFDHDWALNDSGLVDQQTPNDFAQQFHAGRWYTRADVETGAVLYNRYCIACHYQNAEGTNEWKRRDANGNLPPPPLDGSAHAWHHSRSVLRDYIRRGGKPWDGIMPPIDSTVSDTEINAIIAYFQNFWSDEIYSKWFESNGVD